MIENSLAISGGWYTGTGKPYQLAPGCISTLMAIDEASVKPKVMCGMGFTAIQRDGSVVS